VLAEYGLEAASQPPTPAPAAAAAPEGAEALIAPEAAQEGGQEPTGVAHVAANPVTLEAITPEWFNVADLKLSDEVPNFKRAANKKTGVVRPLKGKYQHVGTGPILVWERISGDHEVVSGRHRLNHAKVTGETKILGQRLREADGWTAARVAILDAEANILDNQGEVSDYANYFRNSEITEEEASSRGLLYNDKGRKGWALGKYAADDLYAAYVAGEITLSKAVAIADGAPSHAEKQSLGIQYSDKHNADETAEYMKAISAMAPAKVTQGGLFGFDDAWAVEAGQMARSAAKIVGALRSELTALNAAERLGKAKYAKVLAQYGIKAGDAAAIAARKAELADLLAQWDKWQTDPVLTKQARKNAGLDELDLFSNAPGSQAAEQAAELSAAEAAQKETEARPEATLFGAGVPVGAERVPVRPDVIPEVVQHPDPRRGYRVRTASSARRRSRGSSRLPARVRTRSPAPTSTSRTRRSTPSPTRLCDC
jgi:hypothetical protein